MGKVPNAKDEFTVVCPFCAHASIWSLNLRWHVQADLVCPNCEQNMSRVILLAALSLQKRRLEWSLALTSLVIIGSAGTCLFLVHKFANDLHQMPFFAVALFSGAAIACSLAVAVSIVLTKQLIFLVKRRRLLKQ